MTTITRSMMPNSELAWLIQEALVKSLADQMTAPLRGRPKRHAYKGWPAGAERLNRYLSIVAPRSHTHGIHYRRGIAGAIWECLAAGDGTVRARDALAWLALAKELPFEAPAPFLAKAREDFGEDLPWLALADWIEEQGQGEEAAELRAAVENSRIKAREATITDTEEAQP